MWSIPRWAILLLGGAGRTLGPVLGSVVMWFLLTASDSVLRQLTSSGVITFITNSEIGGIRHALVGVALVVLIVFRPQGLIGNRKEMLVNVK